MELAHRRVKIDKDRTWHVFAIASLGEEGLERARLANVGSLRVETTICLETMLKEISVDVRCQQNTIL